MRHFAPPRVRRLRRGRALRLPPFIPSRRPDFKGWSDANARRRFVSTCAQPSLTPLSTPPPNWREPSTTPLQPDASIRSNSDANELWRLLERHPGEVGTDRFATAVDRGGDEGWWTRNWISKNRGRTSLLRQEHVGVCRSACRSSDAPLYKFGRARKRARTSSWRLPRRICGRLSAEACVSLRMLTFTRLYVAAQRLRG